MRVRGWGSACCLMLIEPCLRPGYGAHTADCQAMAAAPLRCHRHSQPRAPNLPPTAHCAPQGVWCLRDAGRSWLPSGRTPRATSTRTSPWRGPAGTTSRSTAARRSMTATTLPTSWPACAASRRKRWGLGGVGAWMWVDGCKHAVCILHSAFWARHAGWECRGCGCSDQ